jgi:2-methylcitrate dehydratase PrpD
VNVTGTLARFIAHSRWEDIPQPVRHEAKRTLLNFLGCVLGGCRDPAVEQALAVLREFSGPPQAALLGRGERLDVLSASFINGAAANAHDFDDTHLPTVIHPAAPVVPAALALAEGRQIKGSEFLHALLLGVEVECRVGNAVTPWHYAHGWHITSTCGVIGAAAAAARILKLDEAKTAAALGLAANQACGLIESLGTMAKSVSVGNAPRNGLFAALLAERGYTASAQTIEGPRGFAHVMGHDPELSKITAGLGSAWESARNTYKPYPCGIVLHPVIDALLGLRTAAKLDFESIRKVTVTGNPLLRQRTDRPNPASGREAQVSLQHTAAVCLGYGAAGLREYSDAVAAEPAMQAFGKKVEVIDDAALPVEAAKVVIHTADGRTHAREVNAPLGSLANPMSGAQLEAKVRALAAFGAPRCDAGALIRLCWQVAELDDVKKLIKGTVPNA